MNLRKIIIMFSEILIGKILNFLDIKNISPSNKAFKNNF